MDDIRQNKHLLPIFFDLHVTASTARSAIAASIQKYHESTCLRFREKQSSDTNYLRFFSGSG